VGVYFRTDVTRLSFGELWRISSRFPVFLNGCMRKILGVRRPPRHAFYHEEAVIVVPVDEVPSAARRVLEMRVEQLERLGARLLFYQTVRSTRNVAGYSAVLLPPEHNAVILLTWVRVETTGRPAKQSSTCAISSRLEDGTFLSTSDHRGHFDPAPLFKVQRLRGATPEEVLDRHQEALTQAAAVALPVENEEHAKHFLVESRRCTFNWHLSRGVWVPLTPAELAALGLPADDVG
jgi:hypothetical protein